MSGTELGRPVLDPFAATAEAQAIQGIVRSIRASVGRSRLSDTSARILLSDATGRLRPAGQVGDVGPGGRRRSARRREAFEAARPITMRLSSAPSRSVGIFPLPGADRTLGVAEVLAPSEAFEQRQEMIQLAVARAAAELGRIIERHRAERARLQTQAVRQVATELFAAPTAVAAIRRVTMLCHRELGVPVAGAIPDRSSRGWYLVAFAGVGSRRRSALRAELSRVSSEERDLGVLRACFARIMQSEQIVSRRAGPAVLFADPDVAGTELVSSAASLLAEALEQHHAGGDGRETIGIEWAAHELRGPLLSCSAAIERVLLSPGSDRSEQLLKHTHGELTRLAQLVDSLLEWASGSGRLTPCPEKVTGVVREAVAEASVGAKPGRVRVRAEAPIVALVDRDHLRGAVAKVLENSLAYSPDSTRVEVVVERDGADVAIRIRDRGPGVPPDERELIFQPLAQGIGGSRRRAGHGLGLFIARRVIEAHGGSIALTSTRGRGAEFSIRLPAGAGGDAASAS